MKIRLYGYTVDNILLTDSLYQSVEEAQTKAYQKDYDNFGRDRIQLVSVDVNLETIKVIRDKPIKSRKLKPKRKKLKRKTLKL